MSAGPQFWAGEGTIAHFDQVQSAALDLVRQARSFIVTFVDHGEDGFVGAIAIAGDTDDEAMARASAVEQLREIRDEFNERIDAHIARLEEEL